MLGFGAFDLATCREALIAKNAKGFHLRALAGLFAVLEHFEIAWTGHAIFIDNLFLFRHGPPEHKKFADVLNGRGIKFIGQDLKHGFTRCAVVDKDTNLDQSMGIQSGIGFFLDRGSESITTHHDHRVKMVRFGAVFFALGGGQLNLRHAGIIGDEGKNESPN